MEQINDYLSNLQQTISGLNRKSIWEVILVLHEARLQNRQVFILGNGGSASTASHFVCDLAKNTRVMGFPHFRVIGLTDNMALMTAYANDEGYENVFAAQLASLIQPGDVVIGISTSGNSPNVLKAIELATKERAITIGLTGFDGGRLKDLVDHNIHVASECIEHVEDIHLVLEHLICATLRDRVAELDSYPVMAIPSD